MPTLILVLIDQSYPHILMADITKNNILTDSIQVKIKHGARIEVFSQWYNC